MLDFTTGTGTFLLEVIKIILNKIPINTGKQEDCINVHTLKNVHSFECLMALYAVSYLKPSQYLKAICGVGFNNDKNTKLQIFLTNTIDKTELLDQKSFKAFSLQLVKKINLQIKSKKSKYW
ncbi:hypothetical protein QIA00_04840 (plasmid) [Borreliella americana]|uniref:Uncharacterized protein n=1 Tax=Borreliella americana TaxID=478807 RepID=A0ACD5G5S3_9SPIR